LETVSNILVLRTKKPKHVKGVLIFNFLFSLFTLDNTGKFKNRKHGENGEFSLMA